MKHCIISSPVANWVIREADEAIVAIEVTQEPPCPPETPLLMEAVRQLNAYSLGH